MMRNLRVSGLASLLWVSILLVTLPSSLQSQGCPLSLSVTYADVQQLSLADVDFEHFESRALLYTLNMRNDGQTDARAKLHLTIDIRLADGSELNNPVINEVSNEFRIPPTGRVVTNIDLNSSSGGDIRFPKFVLPGEVKDKVQDVALATGRFPAGTYTFSFELVETTCPSPVTADPVVIVITNPSRVELRAPFDGETTNEFPLFEFFLDNAAQAALTVAEVKAGQSREDAVGNQPPMLNVELTGQTSYPYAGGRPLEEGKTYAWQVRIRIPGPAGLDEVSSPIWIFHVSNHPPAGPGDDALLNQLEEMFGHRYPEIFRQIRQGQFGTTGRYLRNGSALSRTDLLDLLNELRGQAEDVDLSFE